MLLGFRVTPQSHSKAELERQLSYSGIDGGARNHAKRGRRKVRVGIRELRMVESVEELRSKLKIIPIAWPAQSEQLRDRKIDVELARPVLPTVNLNGGGGSVVLYFAGFFGLKAEVEGYASQNINFSFPPGSIRCPSGCSGTAAANLFTGSFGPQIKIRIKRVQPFFEGLVGGAHTNFYQNVHKNCAGCLSSSPGDWALAVTLGGGLDIKVTSHLAIRPVEADYFLTRFINNFTTGHNNQNNFRYQAGLVFEF